MLTVMRLCGITGLILYCFNIFCFQVLYASLVIDICTDIIPGIIVGEFGHSCEWIEILEYPVKYYRNEVFPG